MSDTITSPVIPGAHTLTYRDEVWHRFDSHLANNDAYAVMIWEEAHTENERRSTPVRSRAEEPDTYVWSLATSRDLADAEQTVRQLRAEVERLRRELTDERTRQIDGSDYRLTEFWERAGDLADEAGHCQVYDELAEALGGEPRRQDYDVTVTYRYCVSLTRSEVDRFDLNEYDPAEYDLDPDVRVERS